MAVEHQELLDLNIVVSKHLQRWMVERGANPQRNRVCYISVDPDVWRPDPEQRARVRRNLGVDEAVPVVLYAGRICVHKQPRVFAHTMLLLAQMALPFVALVAGDGPDLAWLRSFLKKWKLSGRVHLLGAVSNERIRELMVAADLFFLPSEWEGIALSIYEAMACGLPIVSADVGGQRELVTPECGVLIIRSDEKTEVRRYAEVLAGLLQDPKRGQEIGQAGRRRVSLYFRLEQMGEQVIALLQEAMQLHGSQPRPVPSLDVGLARAAQAVEHIQLVEEIDNLWGGQRGSPSLLSQPRELPGGQWRMSLYFALRRRLLPYYRLGLSRHLRGLLPLKNKLKRVLLGEVWS
jgi:glycosyltransferase involved in cell wall biosynthesis